MPMQLKTPSIPSQARWTVSGRGDVPGHQLDAVGELCAGGGNVADKRHHLIAPLGQAAGDGVADLAGRAGDEKAHTDTLIGAR